MISTKVLNIQCFYLSDMYQEIILRDLGRPRRQDFETDVTWMCDSFGFSSGRDIDKVSRDVVLQLIGDTAKYGMTSPENIARELQTNVQKINYHLRSLNESRFIYRKRGQVFLRADSMKSAVEELRDDANRIFDRLSKIAEEIDDNLGLNQK